MELVKFHENDFMKINIEVVGKAEIVILNVKKPEPSKEEWEDFSKAFEDYYNHRLREKRHKYIMLINVENMSMLSIEKIKKFVKILKDNQDLIEECCVYTVFIVGSYLVKQFFNFALTFYKNKKPVFFKTNFDEVYKEIKAALPSS